MKAIHQRNLAYAKVRSWALKILLGKLRMKSPLLFFGYGRIVSDVLA